jgi:hypothetical protein
MVLVGDAAAFADPAVTNFSNGCLGVDLNADHVALTLADATGNPLTTLRDAPAIR